MLLLLTRSDYPRHDRIRLRDCRSVYISVIRSAPSHTWLASGVTLGMRAPHSVRAPAASRHRSFFQVTLCAAGGLRLRVHAASTSHAVLASASRRVLLMVAFSAGAWWHVLESGRLVAAVRSCRLELSALLGFHDAALAPLSP